MNIEKLVRKNILELEPYRCAQLEFGRGADGTVFLDANENPYENGVNRYPDPVQRALTRKIAQMRGVAPENVLLGNGSDEIIDLLVRSFCEPGRDEIAVFSPGYSMYEVNARINGAGVLKIDMTPDMQPDLDELWRRRGERTKIIFVCTPNNPVGNTVPAAAIGRLCAENDSLVVVDEAYIDFADAPSAAPLIARYPNLVVMQTMSKSWGAAGLRLGVCIADPRVTGILSKVKLPYNIGCLEQQRAVELLEDEEGFAHRIAEIKNERARMYDALLASGVFRRVYPSEANFLLGIADDAPGLYAFLLRNGVVTRLRDIPPLIPGGLRISIGTPAENTRVIELLKQYRTG